MIIQALVRSHHLRDAVDKSVQLGRQLAGQEPSIPKGGMM